MERLQSVGRIRGIKDGKEQTYYVYNNCKHQEAYEETGMQGVSYTTGVPAMIGAMMFFKGIWRKPGVWNLEDFDPDPFMEQLNKQGLPWHEVFGGDLELQDLKHQRNETAKQNGVFFRLIEFVCRQIETVGTIRYRKMFGDYMIYANEKPVIIACDNIAFVKQHEAIEALNGRG